MPRTKRQRCDESGDASDDDDRQPGAAQRKRELERNRRNLVSVRFSELETALSQLPGAPARVQRRIDKEVVLKDAAQALQLQQRALDAATSRISAMTAEVATLRAEKLDLRRDKSYLHRDVSAARAENAALAADNLRLWGALRKSGALANIIAANPSRIPVDVVLDSSQTSSAFDTAPMETFKNLEMNALMKQFGFDDSRAHIMSHQLDNDDTDLSTDIAQCG